MANKKYDTLITIPAYNEAANIANVIDSIRNRFQSADILIIDDGSSDNTQEILKEKDVFTVKHLCNLGIGSSFQTGCKFAAKYNYNYIVRMDGDGQHNPDFINNILVQVKEGKTDIAIGSRFLGDSEFTSSFMRIIGILIISKFLSAITGKKITDPTSGFCAMNNKAFKFFAQNCADDYPEPEILMHHKEFTITEVPITMSKRSKGVSSITPIKSLYYMYKVLFSIFLSLFR